MKLPTSLKLAGAAALALSSSALSAEIALNEQFAISGYIAGSASYTSVDGEDDSNADMDAMKLTAVAKFAPVTVTTSLYAFGAGSGDGFGGSPIFLEAYGTYDFGDGTTTTAGKFLSYLGYEAFDAINMLQISYANPTAAYIPAYHTGIKFDKATDQYSIGIAVTDSLYGPAYYKGDGDLDNGVGFEAMFSYTGIENFTWFTGIGFDTGNDDDSKSFVFDTWAQYVSGQFTYAAEFCYGSTDYKGAPTGDGYFVLGLVKYQVDDKWAATFRLSAGEGEANDDFVRATFAPAYAVTEHLDIVAEYSYTDYDDVDAHFLGVQALFKF